MSRFQQPVLDERFLYFIEELSGDRFRIARTKASLRRRRVQRYRVLFDDRPAFSVYEGELLYGGAQSAGGGRNAVITRDRNPVFR